MRWWILLLASTAISPSAWSQEIVTGKGFLARCSGATEWQRIACLSYVMGLHDMAGYLKPTDKFGLVCAPQGVTIIQYHDILLKYLLDHPERGQKLSAELLWEAAAHAFPCPRL